MSNKIAVIVDATKSLSSFEAGSYINVYCKYNSNWKLEDEIGFSLNHSTTISDFRDYIRTIILKLEDCKIIIGKTVSGLPYNILDRMGFAIFEVEDISALSLDDIFSEVQEYKNNKDDFSVKVSSSPIETDIAGEYFLNLIELQEKHPEISSKKALQEFILTTPFYKLELICSHVPPWFENVLPARKLTYTTEEMQRCMYRVTVYKKICEC